MRIILTGQTLIHHELREDVSPGFAVLARRIRAAGLAFTNFEGGIAPPDLALPKHADAASPATLRNLHSLGFNLLALANNHANEAGLPGIVHTRKLAGDLGFTVAGSGADLAEAMAPGVVDCNGTRVALVAMDTANLQTKDAVAGSGGPPGINPLRGTVENRQATLDAADLERNLAAVRMAAEQAEQVLVSVHEHFWPCTWREVAYLDAWPEEWRPVMAWKKEFARQLIDAGATAVLYHGIPIFGGIEICCGRPVFYSLGNFIFHLRPQVTYWKMPEVWESAVGEMELTGGRLSCLRLLPIVLADAQGDTRVPNCEKLYPQQATGAAAARILGRLAANSPGLSVDGDIGIFSGG